MNAASGKVHLRHAAEDQSHQFQVRDRWGQSHWYRRVQREDQNYQDQVIPSVE